MTGHGRHINGASDRTAATLDSVTKKGTLIYRVGNAVIRDDGIRLAVSRKTTDAGLEAALRMAIERYGTRLTVTGSDEFKEKIATVAAAKRLPVTFADAALEKQRRSLASSGRVEVGGGGAKSLDEGAQNGIEGFGIVKLIKHTYPKAPTMNENFNNAVGPQVRAPRARTGKTIPILAVLSFVAGLQSATQYFAHEFQYQAALGAHVLQLYPPWSILRWAGKWYGIYPDAVMRAGLHRTDGDSLRSNRSGHRQNGACQFSDAKSLPARFGALGEPERHSEYPGYSPALALFGK